MTNMSRKLQMGLTGALVGIGVLLSVQGQAQQGGSGASKSEFRWNVDPMRGPVDLGLTDPALVGAIDVHAHLDPDAPGSGGQVRALDGFEAARIAESRGMRGLVMKTHQDSGSAAIAYMMRKHVSAGFQSFGRMASNFSTGGINVAALEHFSQIKGGWGRIYEMPTRDSCGENCAQHGSKVFAAKQAMDAIDAAGFADLCRGFQEWRPAAGSEILHRRHGQAPNGGQQRPAWCSPPATRPARSTCC